MLPNSDVQAGHLAEDAPTRARYIQAATLMQSRLLAAREQASDSLIIETCLRRDHWTARLGALQEKGFVVQPGSGVELALYSRNKSKEGMDTIDNSVMFSGEHFRSDRNSAMEDLCGTSDSDFRVSANASLRPPLQRRFWLMAACILRVERTRTTTLSRRCTSNATTTSFSTRRSSSATSAWVHIVLANVSTSERNPGMLIILDARCSC